MPAAAKYAGLNATVLGVDFHWSDPGDGFREPVYRGLATIYDAIREHAGYALRRQRRTVIEHWDALTAILRGSFIPAHLKESDEYGLTLELLWAIGKYKLSEKLILEICRFEPVASTRTVIDVFKEGDARGRHLAPAHMRPDRVDYNLHGRQVLQKPGLYRRFLVEMDDLEGEASSIDWFRTMLLAVLVQFRASAEILIETGFFPVRRCEREACHAYFHVKRMASRQRFCSDTCRACDPREH